MKNEVLRKEVVELVKNGLSQVKVASRLHLTRERINQICEELFGKGIVVERYMLSLAGKLFLRALRTVVERKNFPSLVWVIEEAFRRRFKVHLPINANRGEYNVLVINGFRVAVYTTTSVRLYKPYRYMPGIPAYHWEVRKSATEADFFILLAFFEGVVKHAVVIPVDKARRYNFLPLQPKLRRDAFQEPLWNYVGEWQLLTRKRERIPLRKVA